MEQEGQLPDWWMQPLSALDPLNLASVRSEVSISEAVRRMKEEGVVQLPVVDEQGLELRDIYIFFYMGRT